MITYNDVYEAARKERYSEQLQPIRKNFISEVAKYLKEKRDISNKEDDVFSDVIVKTKKQLENAITLFKELMRIRRKKILNLVLIAAETGISKRDFENMLQIEKDLFEELMKNIEISDKAINDLLNGGEIQESSNTMILFLKNVDEFPDFEGNMKGPYEKGQIANLSKDVAKILVGDDRAEFLEK